MTPATTQHSTHAQQANIHSDVHSRTINTRSASACASATRSISNFWTCKGDTTPTAAQHTPRDRRHSFTVGIRGVAAALRVGATRSASSCTHNAASAVHAIHLTFRRASFCSRRSLFSSTVRTTVLCKLRSSVAFSCGAHTQAQSLSHNGEKRDGTNRHHGRGSSETPAADRHTPPPRAVEMPP